MDIKKCIGAKDFCIKTERLLLRPTGEASAQAVFRNYTAEIARYQYPAPYADAEEAKNVILIFDELRKSGTDVVFDILLNGAFIGTADIHGLDTDSPEVGLWIVFEQQRRGYGYEAITGMINFFRDSFGFHRFVYEADRRNLPSVALASRLCGRKVGENEVKSMDGRTLFLDMYIIER